MANNPSVPPVTYLNKRQEYRLTITDTDPPSHPSDRFRARYRTHITISFHREDQRSDPDAHWRLWKAARRGQHNEEPGEGAESGRSPNAIELCLIKPKPQPEGTVLTTGGINDRGPDIHLETSSFNGFCILWSYNRSETGLSIPSPSSSVLPFLPECTITVRFNFLTTDFCHYKGVKGFPVRLCARTEMVSDRRGKLSPSPVPAREEEAVAEEVCYCKVNLFRMYGAERKLATDAAGVRKAREKVCREIHKRQGQSRGTGIRPGSEAAGKQSIRSYQNQMRILEQLQEKLVSLQTMLSSARPITVFSLRGDASDIPDWSSDDHSVHYHHASSVYQSRQSTISDRDYVDESSSSSISTIGYPWETGLLLESESLSPSDPLDGTRSNEAIRVSRNSFEDGTDRYIEVLDIDPTYRPPTRQQSKSGKKHQPLSNPLSLVLALSEISYLVACFYIGFAGIDYHVAVYLTELTTHGLIEGISKKLGIDPQRIWRVLLVRGNSVQIVDDIVVRGISDEQDMLAEISETWSFDGTSENPIEIRLIY
ncbi:CP2 transcription factor-domain-containing protein [Aspergillus insuetus]